MPPYIYLAPPAAGKTRFLLQQLRRQGADPAHSPRLVVSTPLQRRAAQRQLAAMGGGFGVHIITMNGLGSSLLGAAGLSLSRLADPVVVRLLRVAIDQSSLQFYAPLRTSPGLARSIRRLIAELQTNAIGPQRFTAAAAGAPPAVQELATIYRHYNELLDRHQASDGPGWIGRVYSLLKAHPQAIPRWHWLAFDGFDHLSPAEIELMALLASHVQNLIITLPQPHAPDQTLVQAATTAETVKQLAQALHVEPEPLPATGTGQRSHLHFLARHIFRRSPSPSPPQSDVIHFLAAADMQQEVREALRWLKMRYVYDHMALTDLALLVRSLGPYRLIIRQVAAEMGVPVHIPGGLPLRQNPAIAALLGLLKLPVASEKHDQSFALRPMLDAWRSPYFDWRDYLPDPGDEQAPGMLQAEALDRVGRWGCVTGGREQWREVFQLLLALPAGPDNSEEDRSATAGLPRGAAARALWQGFQAFVAAITPPAGPHPLPEYVRWLEDLIGPDPAFASPQGAASTAPSLRMVSCIRQQADADLRRRDLAAMQAMKDVLRGMVSAAIMVPQPPIDYAAFLADLLGAVDAAHYDVDVADMGPAILAADVVQARGLRFRAAAVLGLAEGAFPGHVRENSLISDAERRRLAQADVPLPSALRSEEAALFHHAITRVDEQLLLTRPRLSDSGAKWPPSPYWHELQRWLDIPEKQLTHTHAVPPEEAASWPEVMQWYASQPRIAGTAGPDQVPPARWQRVQHGAVVLQQRLKRQAAQHDGQLRAYGAQFRQRYHERRVWSASQLETYHHCPFRWFSQYALRLEERPEPQPGLTDAQLGTIYHELLRRCYDEAPDPTDEASLLHTLHKVAAEYLPRAPQLVGFRTTAWWQHTQHNIVQTLEHTIRRLVATGQQWHPFAFEQSFGSGKYGPLLVSAKGRSIRLRGTIDRVDTDNQGHARLIDYKKGGVSRYDLKKLQQGTLLQLPLYALAVEQRLGIRQVSEAFYWSVEKAEKSRLILSPALVDGGIDPFLLARELAVQAVEQIQQGEFAPRSPDDGCPSFCPASDFCWHYRPRRG